MKNKCSVLVIAILVSLLCNNASIAEDLIFVKKPTLRGQEYVPGEIIVKFKPGTPGRVMADLNSKHGASVIYTSPFAGFKRLRIPRGRTLAQMVGIYKRNPNVGYAEINYIAHAHMVPNDPSYNPYQWHLDNTEYGGINMESAWDIETGNPDIIVAVIDTGVAYEDYTERTPIGGSGKYRDGAIYGQAPDLAQTNFVPGYDFVNDDSHPNDDEGHGTHVTGTIAQSTNNAIGTAGVAFNCSIMPIKVLDSRGSGTHTDIADGIYYAADNGAGIINMSLGGSTGSITLENAVTYAYNAGVTIVCSSGNDGSATVGYPAAYDAYCIAVGATRYDEAVAYYSNGGSSLDLTAPGGDVTVDLNMDGYGDGVLQQTFGDTLTDWSYWFYQGTSMAAPHVSGVAALLISNGAATTPDEVREILQSTAEDKGAAGWDPAYGWGIVDAYAALSHSVADNNLPVADAGGPYAGTEDIAVSFDGSLSSDPDGDTMSYMWDFGDGVKGAGATPSHTYTAGGTYTVTLVINDGKANSDTAATTATIDEVDDPPVADAGPDQSALVGETVNFDGSDSYCIDDGDTLTTYSWNFGYDSTGSGEVTTHAYTTAGIYTVTLTVTDNDGLPGVDTATVTVTEQPTEANMYVANIEMSLSTRTAGRNTFTKAYATATIVDASGNVEGAMVYGTWSVATSDTDSGATESDGKVTLESDELKNASGKTFTFTVDDVVKSDGTYYPGDNIETSNSITVP